MSRFAIFDHVPKTGGTAINHALLEIFSAERVAINCHVNIAANELEFADRFPIITGHFGGNWRRDLRRRRDRMAFTVIRHPVNRAISTYSYWRNRIATDHPDFQAPTVQAAKTLGFSAFIRSDVRLVKLNLFNTHYAMLAGGEAYETAWRPEGQAGYSRKIQDLVDEFDVIGVAERLSETLQCLLRNIGFTESLDTSALLARAEKNSSPPLGEAEILSEDVRFLVERNALDLDLHAAAAARLDRLMRTYSDASVSDHLGVRR